MLFICAFVCIYLNIMKANVHKYRSFPVDQLQHQRFHKGPHPSLHFTGEAGNKEVKKLPTATLLVTARAGFTGRWWNLRTQSFSHCVCTVRHLFNWTTDFPRLLAGTMQSSFIIILGMMTSSYYAFAFCLKEVEGSVKENSVDQDFGLNQTITSGDLCSPGLSRVPGLDASLQCHPLLLRDPRHLPGCVPAALPMPHVQAFTSSVPKALS